VAAWQSAAQRYPQAVSLDQEIAQASTRIVRAMIGHPEMVGGTKRFDSDLLRAARGKLVCKIGAEAVYGIGVLPSERHPRGLGISLKIEDGAYRGLGPAVIETLAQLDVLDESEQAGLASYHRPSLDNRSGVIVGEVRAIFRLV
jgi:L-asparaginase II